MGGDEDAEDGVDAAFKQLESELERTFANPPAEGENPLPTTLISSLDPAGKSGVQRTHVS